MTIAVWLDKFAIGETILIVGTIFVVFLIGFLCGRYYYKDAKEEYVEANNFDRNKFSVRNGYQKLYIKKDAKDEEGVK